MRDTADLSAGRTVDGSYDESMPDRLLTQDEHVRVTTKLTDMLISVCDYCHERLGNLLSAGTNEKDKLQNEKDNMPESSLNKIEDKENHTPIEKTSWLSDRATTTQVCQLANIVEEFTEVCEKFCGKQCTALRSAFKVEDFLNRSFSFYNYYDIQNC